MFEIKGIGKEMAELSQIHLSLPYLLTIVVASVFFIFGLYGLSAANKFKKLPNLKFVIFSISGIYLLRGLVELLISFLIKEEQAFNETIFSLSSISLGMLFLYGGIQRWRSNKNDI